MSFLEEASHYIRVNKEEELLRLVKKNTKEIVTVSEFFSFADMFSKEIKNKIKGAINIHGMGGTGIPKINLTSIACLYISTICDKPIVKTGSRKNKSIMGSTDFFEILGLLDIKEKEKIFEEFGFAYYDYLELSPWKRYKSILNNNMCIKDIITNTHFFDYEMGILGLGIASEEAYHVFQQKKLYCEPKEIFNFYTIVGNTNIDEIVPGKIFLDGVLIKNQIMTLPEIKTEHEILNTSLKLINGIAEKDYWYKALRITVAILLNRLGIVASCEEGEDMFEKSYRDKLVYKQLEKMKKYS